MEPSPEQLDYFRLSIEMAYSIFWLFTLLLIFSPKWAPKKAYQYKSRKLRISIVLIAIMTAFYALGKIDTFNGYAIAVFSIFSVLTGANVTQKYIEGRKSVSKNTGSTSGKG